jgi:hypothetical protein
MHNDSLLNRRFSREALPRITHFLEPLSTALHNNNSHPCDEQPLLRVSNEPSWDMRKRSANPAAQSQAVDAKLTVSIPKTGKPSTAASEVKSLIRNILLASPAFPRLYADVVISSAPNSNEAKILARNYQKLIDRTNRINMPIHPSVKVCTHIKVTGVRCGSPALRGEQFCYFGLHSSDMVKQVPEYAASAGAETASAATAHVGTAAPGCPGGPEVPGRGAGAPKPAPTPPTKVIERKPPLSVKEAEAPKERKIAAHSLP